MHTHAPMIGHELAMGIESAQVMISQFMHRIFLYSALYKYFIFVKCQQRTLHTDDMMHTDIFAFRSAQRTAFQDERMPKGIKLLLRLPYLITGRNGPER